MKTICLYFEIHQIIHLKRYRFFDIGTDHYYYDDYENERSISDIAERSYMPALNTLHEMIKENGKYFKVAFSLSGVGIEQLEMHAPQVLEKLQEMNETGCVEFLAEPYSHGLSSLINAECFAADVKKQMAKMKEYFGQTPKVLRNSSLIYSDDIGLQAAEMGFKGMLTEGAKHVLGWKSPHYVYNCALAPNLKLLLRDVKLSDDISLRFNNPEWEGYPLFADNYVNEIASHPEESQINLHGTLGTGHRSAVVVEHSRLPARHSRLRKGEGHHVLHSYRDLHEDQERWCSRCARHTLVGRRGARRELLAG